jgi:hypothetical protein
VTGAAMPPFSIEDSFMDKMMKYKGCNVKSGKYSDGGKATFGEPKAVAHSHRSSKGVKRFKDAGTNFSGKKYK